MEKEDIIREWKKGLKKETVAKEYMKSENKRRKALGEKQITAHDALAHVEPIIFEYQKQVMRGAEDGYNDRGTIETNA
ncbi:hypothetical protein IJD44_07725 [bacterium]|nr:hypothetical protein [bacterium]